MKRRIAGLVDAIERGIITPTTKARLEGLEAELAALEQAPADPVMPAIHPNLATRYREAVADLEAALADSELAAEAKATLRALIKTIVVYPCEKRGEVTIELQGQLATILGIAKGAKANARTGRRTK